MQKASQTTSSLTSESMLDAVSFSNLIKDCEREVESVRSGHPHGDQSCVKLLHLATVHDDRRAWEAIARSFRPLVRQWLSYHGHDPRILQSGSEEYYIALTFAEFRRVTRERCVEFASLSSALRCLFTCLNATILDALRSSGPLVQGPAVDSLHSTRQIDAVKIMEMLRQFLPGTRELRLAYLLFHCGLQPAEILHVCSQEFSDLQEIYQLRCSIMKRLVDNADDLHHLS